MSRITFYDPLYDFVSFEDAELERPRGVFDAGFSTAPITNASKSLLPFLGTPEMTRLSFLRQGDLSFLVFPSATHTRFAHAVGCCYLGYLAAREIMVTVKGFEERHLFLSKWLEERGWKEEFLLALLLHDVGHFAFSHALENDTDLWRALGTKVDHADVSCQFIKGAGEFMDAFHRRRPEFQDYTSISQVIHESPDIDANVVSFLISGDKSFLQGQDDNGRASMRLLHELTSGLLDLDRIDHYRRDSYFSGMKFASNLNFNSLLNGFNICYQADDVGGKHEVQLSKEAIGHALTLLHAKERLVHDCFENVNNLAYEVMLHQAFNYFCFGDDFFSPDWKKGQEEADLKKFVYELLVATDEELLIEMFARGTDKVKRIVGRIRNRRPYTFIGRHVCVQRNPKDIVQLRIGIARAANTTVDNVAIRLGKHFGESRERRPAEWLHLDALNDESGFPLSEHEEYMRQIAHFKSIQDESPNVFWLFTPADDAQTKERLHAALNALKPRPA